MARHNLVVGENLIIADEWKIYDDGSARLHCELKPGVKINGRAYGEDYDTQYFGIHVTHNYLTRKGWTDTGGRFYGSGRGTYPDAFTDSARAILTGVIMEHAPEWTGVSADDITGRIARRREYLTEQLESELAKYTREVGTLVHSCPAKLKVT